MCVCVCQIKNRLKLYTGTVFVIDTNQVVEIKAYTKNKL